MRKMLTIVFGLWLCTGFGLSAAAGGELTTILAKSAAYCEKLKQAVFHFVCYEQVEEADKEKNTYLNDYRILKIGDRVKEQRSLMEHNGQKVAGKAMKLQTNIYSYKASLTPIYLLAAENQQHYDYRVIEKKRVLNRQAYGIEIRVTGDADKDALAAIVWVDVEDFSVLKFKAFPEVMPGFKDLFADAKGKGMKLEIDDIHYFGIKRGDIRFPSRTEITIRYYPKPQSTFFLLRGRPRYGIPKRQKIETVFLYKDYRFFEVDVGDPVFNNRQR